MNFITITLLILGTILQINAKSKYNDEEDHPYEFGFTVDGQQHRHEMKDTNGIIQGEFGFITADGIYHTTVYATDENGNFKILSMRNVRVSPPLDQLEGKIQSFQQGQNLPSTPPPPPTARPQREPSIASAGAQPPNPPPPPAYASSTHAPFTTRATIKPACAGCGYVTTEKPIPGQPITLPFQTLVFNNPSSQIIGPHKVDGAKPLPGGQQYNELAGQRGGDGGGGLQAVGVHDKGDGGRGGFSQVPPGSPPQSPIDLLNNNPSPIFGQLPINPSSQNFNNPIGNPPINKYPINGNQVAPPIAGIPNKEPIPFGDPHGGVPQFNPNPAVGLINPPTNNQPINGQTHVIPRPIRDDITVNNGQISIPNHDPIPIKDKFPGMVDGLPPGVTQNDITDLLYRFNYTVGFHGHYEKGYKNGAKVGGYFVNDRDGVSRIVTYVADENGYRPKVKFIRLDLTSDDVPKEGSEKKFGLKNFEFVWYPIS